MISDGAEPVEAAAFTHLSSNSLSHCANRLNRSLAMAWASWVESWKGVRREREMLSRALKRAFNQLVAGAFTSWAEAAAEAKRHRTLLKRCV